MTLSDQRRPASTGSRVMLAMVAVLSAALAAAVFAFWKEKARDAELARLAESRFEARPEASVHTTSFYMFSLAKLVEPRCGPTPRDSLHAAGDAERDFDPGLEQRALAAAAARAATITTNQSCDYVISEIKAGEMRAQAAGH